ncbi:DUF475 domain-containing protein [Tersicoccus sp. Bi-70]|uniref:DUF475 domain-containing protein n=1 Tax=Tersicoccus sp. Bi-70 TaxID=1897634 RepID=UPI0009782475|nr:DUF475 domain-containing protein [Tersicoccus sp. Bi-70]OMH36926.1 hypothetical protein BGP79_14460 [Tersicoccus sp. Bi-70]
MPFPHSTVTPAHAPTPGSDSSPSAHRPATSPRRLNLPFLLIVIGFAAAWLAISPTAAFAFLALATMEIAMVADSSVPMAGIASRLRSPARKLFLSVGLIAVVLGMRLLLPPTAVAVSEHESLATSAREVVTQPDLFTAHLAAARPGLAAFGAAFIWLVFAEYLFNVDRVKRRPWLSWPEAVLARIRHSRVASYLTALLLTGGMVLLAPAGLTTSAALGGLIGIFVYGLSNAVSASAQRNPHGPVSLHVHALTVVFERAITVFMLFEIVDGTYTLTPSGRSYLLEQVAVAGGAVLVGAVFLSRLTAHVDATNGLKRLRHLKAGAAYLLGALSLMLALSLAVPIPGMLAGWVGTGIIGAAFLTSLPWKRVPRAIRARIG